MREEALELRSQLRATLRQHAEQILRVLDFHMLKGEAEWGEGGNERGREGDGCRVRQSGVWCVCGCVDKSLM